ncbi:hypothetical protein ABH924_003779 [Arthrobacter sp. GAS37]|uniref:hypothetical protein n=1 Tax=Arthrobacter sp. GAS37 TaxID=3156261 RepID=UPI003838BDBC
MSRPAVGSPLSGPDVLFAGLVSRVREAGWDSPEGRQLLGSVLPALVRPLAARFPALESGEAFHLAWKIAKRPGFDKAHNPRAWLVTAVRSELGRLERDLDKAQRDLVEDIDRVKVLHWQENSSGEDDWGVVPDDPDPDGPADVWDELLVLLARLGCPEDLAARAVEVLRVRAEKERVSVKATARALRFLPEGCREPLARIAFTKPGFLWARLHGISWERAVDMSADDLAALVHHDQGAPGMDEETGSGDIGHARLAIV